MPFMNVLVQSARTHRYHFTSRQVEQTSASASSFISISALAAVGPFGNCSAMVSIYRREQNLRTVAFVSSFKR